MIFLTIKMRQWGVATYYLIFICKTYNDCISLMTVSLQKLLKLKLMLACSEKQLQLFNFSWKKINQFLPIETVLNDFALLNNPVSKRHLIFFLGVL